MPDYNKIVLGENIKKLRTINKMTQVDLAKKLGVAQNAVSNWEKGLREPDNFNILIQLSQIFNVSLDELLSCSSNQHIRVQLPNPELMRTVPIYGNISCGTGMFVDDEIIDYVTVPVSMLPDKSIEVFGMFAEGDSMINAGINSGDLIIFKKTNYIENGQIGCFCVDDNMATCKKFYKNDEDNIITLSPANDKYAPITITVENMGFHIVGKLVLKLGRFD